ncbi:gluconate 2-dehydrogenase subunit 3 family protein [Mixta sp. Marseille-Q2659]|uniref:gluconate 2-dehydrogenase subunit 3 family protein n=1 Tax=Mixta sp. Marseille-Q2659 TaxID=2736607 RepID=UPI0023B92064|nr:gluconate 2-dehydrogenase subunit 3 family protein [Mixta sp. Marseille-Q2659]
MKRREFLSSIAALSVTSALPVASAQEVKGGLQFFTPHEFATVGTIAEIFIPADELSISGKEAGCATFIDRQLASDYGRATTLYRRGRFIKGTPEQGPQSPLTPAERYRQGLTALDAYTQKQFGKNFIDLTNAQQVTLLTAMEANQLNLGADVETKPFFELMLQNVREGFLADPIYGGNKDMTSWKMLGFPGARYDFRDVLSKKGQKLNIIPTSLIDNTL